MERMKLSIALVLSFTFLLANSFTSIAQSDAERQKIADEFFHKGITASEKGNYREAVEDYTVVISLYPDSFWVYEGRGDAKVELKDYKAAIEDYDTYIKICTANNKRAQKLSSEQAVTNINVNFAPNFKGGITLSSQCTMGLPTVYNKRGVAKYKLGDKLGACKDFREGCKLGLEPLACENSESICNDTVSSDTKNKQPSSSQSKGSPYEGKYKGEWTATPAPYSSFKGGEEEQNGTWDISIASDGEITGTEFVETSGEEGTIKGFIDEKGIVHVSVKYETTSKIEGKLEMNGIRLVGKLKQYCGESHCLNIRIVLKRK